jgi:hypothetical protein
MDRKMSYTRIYSDHDGQSQFEDVTVPLLDNGIVGFLSTIYKVSGLQFRENKENYDWDFHNAPASQFIILLDGEIEIETSEGKVRRFKGGDILFVEDVSGRGHRTRNISQHVRKSLFVKLSDNTEVT